MRQCPVWFGSAVTVVAVLVYMALPSCVFAQGTADAIPSYAVDMTVLPSGKVQIEERIQYDFGLVEGHGIFRSIPERYRRGVWNDNIELQLKEVVDASGDPDPVEEVRPSDFDEPGGNKVWKIGSSAVWVSGLQTYILRYTADWVIEHRDGFDELSWNATGTSWDVPMKRLTVSVHLPGTGLASQVQPLCFTGVYGSTEQNCEVRVVSPTTVVFTTQSLDVYEGMTVAVPMASGVIQKKSTAEQAVHFFLNNWSVFPSVVLFFVFLLFLMLLRSPRSHHPLIPIYTAPANMPAHMAEYVWTGELTERTVTATLIQLARDGYIHFVYDENKKKVTTLKRIKEYDGTDEVVKKIWQTILGAKQEVIVAKTTVNRLELLTSLKTINDQIVLHNGWYNATHKTKLTVFGVIMAVVTITSLGAMVVGYQSVRPHFMWSGAFGILAMVMMVASRRILRPLSQQGADLVQELEGFRWFLRVTQTERLQFTNAPQLTPTLFEALLPYAVIFGVEQEWVKQFESVLQQPPAWLEGAPHSSYLFLPAVLSSAHSGHYFRVPVNARGGIWSRGGSSFGGGGFSGGGFGGGGGGRW